MVTRYRHRGRAASRPILIRGVLATFLACLWASTGCTIMQAQRQRAPTTDDLVVLSPNPGLRDMVGVSPCIFTGTVTGLRFGHHETTGPEFPYTFVRFSGVQLVTTSGQVRRGKDGSLEISYLGGIGEDLHGMIVNPSPKFTLGSRYIVFLRGGGWRTSPLAGADSGYFLLWGDVDDDESYVLSPAGLPLQKIVDGTPVFVRPERVDSQPEAEVAPLTMEEARQLGLVRETEPTPQEIKAYTERRRQRDAHAQVEARRARETERSAFFAHQRGKAMTLSEFKKEIEVLLPATRGQYKGFDRLYSTPVPFPEEGFRLAPVTK